MNPTILLRGESFTSMTISADNHVVVAAGDKPAVQTTTRPTPVVNVDLAQTEVLPKGYVTVDQLVAEVELNPAQRVEIEKARKWIGSAFYKDEKTLRAIRLRRGWSQAKLASAIGSTQAHIARIESGSDVQISTLLRIAAAVDMPRLAIVEAYLNCHRAGAMEE